VGGGTSKAREVAGGGRWVEVDPARLPRWLDGFRERHGSLTAHQGEGLLAVTGEDGAVAELHRPPGAAGGTDLAGFVADAQRPRRLGLLLARKAAAAIGIADGPDLITSKVDSWYVQGRTAAGGQSQQRFARRRVNQASAAAGKAADIVARLLLPAAGELAALVTGGDRATVEAILADPRLTSLVPLRSERHLPVPTPNLAVLRAAVAGARAVGIHLPTAVDHETRSAEPA
jgi:Actinobacteria/chloroflexi VLRF1 release factor